MVANHIWAPSPEVRKHLHLQCGAGGKEGGCILAVCEIAAGLICEPGG